MSSQGSVRHVLVLMAMAHEALPLIERLALAPVPANTLVPSPAVVYRGRHAHTTVTLVVNGARPVRELSGQLRQGALVEGVSVVSAAMATTDALRSLGRTELPV